VSRLRGGACEQQLLDPSLPGTAKPVSLIPLNSDSSCSGGHAILLRMEARIRG
jgi:hypothetical protein